MVVMGKLDVVVEGARRGGSRILTSDNKTLIRTEGIRQTQNDQVENEALPFFEINLRGLLVAHSRVSNVADEIHTYRYRTVPYRPYALKTSLPCQFVRLVRVSSIYSVAL